MKSTIDHALYDPNQPLYQRFSTIQTQFDVTLGKIRALCSDSDIETLVNGDTTMYNRLANVELTATGLISDVSRVEAKYDAQSGQITTLQSDLSSFMQDESGFRQTVSSTYYTQENARIDKEALQGDISDISDDLEQNYSTTLQMQSAIEESARQIRLSVSETYATQVSLAQKNASYSGDAIPTNDNLPASQWNTDEEKRTHINDLYVTTDGKTYQYVQGIHGLRIKFDERCLLSSYVGNYVYIYYQLDGKTYRMPIMRRSELSGAVVFVPSNVFWLHFGSGSSSGEYGFKIESMEWKYDCVPSNAVEASLPSYSVVEVSGNTYPESSHPYEKNTNLFWKYTSSYSADSATTYGWADRNTRIDDIEERMSSAELKITNDAIVSTVRTSSSYLSDLSGKANTSDLNGLITADDAEEIAESVIEQTADSIRLKASKIAWSSTYSSMTQNGHLSCTGATIEGVVKTIDTDNSEATTLEGGRIYFYEHLNAQDTVTGHISACSNDIGTGLGNSVGIGILSSAYTDTLRFGFISGTGGEKIRLRLYQNPNPLSGYMIELMGTTYITPDLDVAGTIYSSNIRHGKSGIIQMSLKANAITYKGPIEFTPTTNKPLVFVTVDTGNSYKRGLAPIVYSVNRTSFFVAVNNPTSEAINVSVYYFVLEHIYAD